MKSKNKQIDYNKQTYDSNNPLKRFSHRTRFKYSVDLLSIKPEDRILDFGCGDGYFLTQLSQITSIDLTLIGYEPFMIPKITDNVLFYNQWSAITKTTEDNGLFDYVTCFEVMEHLTEATQNDSLKKIASVLKSDGLFVVSVPIEKGIPSLVKNLFRIFAHLEREFYSYKNLIPSLLGKPQIQYRTGDGSVSHMGFYFDDFERVVSQYFRVEKRFYSPFPALNYNFNSQVFYVFKKK